MTQTSLEILPASVFTYLVQFTWGGGPTIARYCRWTSNLVVAAQDWLHDPSLKVFMDQPMKGTTEDTPMHIEASSLLPPMDTLIQITAHTKVNVVVSVVVPTDAAATLQELFTGQVTKVTVKHGSRLANLKIAGVKRKLKTRAGVQALSTCPWIFGQAPCQAVADTKNGTITNLDAGGKPNGIDIAITGSPNVSNDKWARGYVTVDGLRIAIRKSNETASSPYRFQLREIPPLDWLGSPCVITEGCIKTITACRSKGQEANFGGIGVAMQDRNPVYSAH